MRDGIYRVEFRSGQTIGKGIAVAKNDTIRGFDETLFLFRWPLGKVWKTQATCPRHEIRTAGAGVFQPRLPSDSL